MNSDDKTKFENERLLNACWAAMQDALPDIRRIADGNEKALDNISSNDKYLILGVFNLLAAILLTRRAEAAELEEH